MDSTPLIATVLFFAVLIIVFMITQRPKVRNPFKYYEIFSQLKIDKSYNNVTLIGKTDFPFIFDQDLIYEIQGDFEDYMFMLYLKQRNNTLNISLQSSHHFAEMGLEIIWDPVNLNYNSSSHIGKHLKMQIKELLQNGNPNAEIAYKLKIPVERN